MLLLAILLLLLLGAFFFGAESAFVSANRLRTEISTLRTGHAATAVRKLYERPGDVMATTLAGRTIVLVAYASLVVVYLAPPVTHFFSTTAGASAGVSALLSFLSLSILAAGALLLLSVILPGVIMRETANRSIFIVALPLRAMVFVLAPFTWLMRAVSDLVVRPFRLNDNATRRLMRREFEWRYADNRVDSAGAPDDDGAELLENVLNMADVRVKESMVPRTDIIGIDERATINEVVDRFVETGFSKLPVYRENIDRVVGIVFAHDLFSKPQSMNEIMRPARYVPESKLSKNLLREFLGAGTSIAIVIDEYGGTAGLVTREDLLEELFGDIQDEFDAEEDMMRQIGENLYIVSGRVQVEELNDRYDLDISDGDYETIAGFVLEHTGSIPSMHDEVLIGHLRVTILRGTVSRIDLMKVERVAEVYPDDA